MSKEAKEEIARLKSVRGAFKGHCTRDIELAERRLDRRMRDIAEKDSEIQKGLAIDALEKDIEGNQRYTQHFKHHPSGKIQFVEQSIKSHRPSHSCAQDMEKENH